MTPGGYQVVKADPVLRWTFAQMPPGSVQNLTYEATTKGRLAALVADQQREEALYAAQARISIRVLHALVVVPPVVTMAPGGTVSLAVAGTFDDGTVAPAEAFKAQFVSSNPAAASAVLAKHTTPEKAGEIFARVKPRLAVYSHAPNAERVITQTRTTYTGPLQGAEDMLTIEIGDDTIDVRHFAR